MVCIPKSGASTASVEPGTGAARVMVTVGNAKVGSMVVPGVVRVIPVTDPAPLTVKVPAAPPPFTKVSVSVAGSYPVPELRIWILPLLRLKSVTTAVAPVPLPPLTTTLGLKEYPLPPAVTLMVSTPMIAEAWACLPVTPLGAVGAVIVTTGAAT